MQFSAKRCLALSLFFLAATVQASTPPRVSVSIAPLHSLVASLMQGVGEPEVIYEASQSPHSGALTPFQLRTIVNTDLLIWVGPELEVGLSRLVSRLPSQAVALTLHDYETGMTLYPIRDTLFDAPGHSTDHDHDHGDIDPHFWLSIENVEIFAAAVASHLSELDPANADQYQSNLADLSANLGELDEHLAERLAGFGQVPYIVLHDGFQYFDRSYSLNALGALVLNPDIPPGPRTVANLAEIGQQQDSLCLFREPQYSERWMQPLTQAIPDAGIGQIDPLGVTFPPGPSLYFDMMTALADNLLTCFSSVENNPSRDPS